MRLLALVPVVLSLGALVLSFLALFAGYSKTFLEDYSIVTLNTSRIGEGYFNTSESSSNPIVNFLDGIGNRIEGDIENGLDSLAKELGLKDFYSWHVLTFCEGYYTPTDMPNSTVSASQIHQNITSCANRTAIYDLRPAQILQSQLDASGHSNINVTELGVPADFDDSLSLIRAVAKAMYILYIVGIVLTFLAVTLAVLGICLDGRLSASLNVLVDLLAFAVLAAASAIATAVGVKGADEVNKTVGRVGISATRGTKFLAITWAAVGCMFLASLVWCVACIVGRRSSRRQHTSGKYME